MFNDILSSDSETIIALIVALIIGFVLGRIKPIKSK